MGGSRSLEPLIIITCCRARKRLGTAAFWQRNKQGQPSEILLAPIREAAHCRDFYRIGCVTQAVNALPQPRRSGCPVDATGAAWMAGALRARATGSEASFLFGDSCDARGSILIINTNAEKTEVA